MNPEEKKPAAKMMAGLDQILRSEEELAPSSGFAASVMDRVREEAAAPQPIPFPWKRVVPGMTVAAAGLVWCGVKLAQMGFSNAGTLTLIGSHAATITQPLESAGWVAGALGVSLLSWLLARRLVGRDGML